MNNKKNNKATKNTTALNSAATPDFVELSDDQLENCTGGEICTISFVDVPWYNIFRWDYWKVDIPKPPANILKDIEDNYDGNYVDGYLEINEWNWDKFKSKYIKSSFDGWNWVHVFTYK